MQNIRNEMFMVSEAIRTLEKQNVAFTPNEAAALKTYKGALDDSTKFIPTWVKVSVAVALGLGTMVGWKRIVITVGEKIGKTHMNYGQGAVGRTDRCRNHRGRGHVWFACLHDACAVQRRRRNDGGQRRRAAVEHGAQHDHGLGVDLAGCDPYVGLSLLSIASGDVVWGLWAHQTNSFPAARSRYLNMESTTAAAHSDGVP